MSGKISQLHELRVRIMQISLRRLVFHPTGVDCLSTELYLTSSVHLSHNSPHPPTQYTQIHTQLSADLRKQYKSKFLG